MATPRPNRQLDTLRRDVWRKHMFHPNRFDYGRRVPFFRRWIEKSAWVDNHVNSILVGRIITSQRQRRA